MFYKPASAWDADTEVGAKIWRQIEEALAGCKPLNAAHREILLELLQRSKTPAARKALRFSRPRQKRTDGRNGDIAYEYVKARADGASGLKAEAAVYERFPETKVDVIRHVIESRTWLNRGRLTLAYERAKGRSQRRPTVDDLLAVYPKKKTR